MSLETLVQKPGRHDGKLVRVVGQFRGHNLFGDLPSNSTRSQQPTGSSRTSCSPSGSPARSPRATASHSTRGMRRDAGRWLEVTGRPETVSGVVYLRASSVSLTAAKAARRPGGCAPPPAPVTAQARKPPMIVFTLPLDGEREVPPVGRSSSSSTTTWTSRRSVTGSSFAMWGRDASGDREFVGLKLSYDGGRRALGVDPGDVLRPGREVEIVLLAGHPGHRGAGTRAPPRPGDAAGCAEVVRYRVAPGFPGAK